MKVDVQNPQFSLADLLALNLQNYVDDVGEVVDRANKEDKMQQTLDKLNESWAVVEFTFEQHNGTDVYLIGMAVRCTPRKSHSHHPTSLAHIT